MTAQRSDTYPGAQLPEAYSVDASYHADDDTLTSLVRIGDEDDPHEYLIIPKGDQQPQTRPAAAPNASASNYGTPPWQAAETAGQIGEGDYDLHLSVRGSRAMGSFDGSKVAIAKALQHLDPEAARAAEESRAAEAARATSKHNTDFTEHDILKLKKQLAGSGYDLQRALEASGDGDLTAVTPQVSVPEEPLAVGTWQAVNHTKRNRRIMLGAAGWLLIGSTFSFGTHSLGHGVVEKSVAVIDGPVRCGEIVGKFTMDLIHIGKKAKSIIP